MTSLAVSARKVAAGHTVTVTDTTKDRGPGRAGLSTTGYYLSKGKSWSRSAKLLGTRGVSKLRAGQKATGKKAVKIPTGTAAGTFYLVACADAKKKVREANENNNCRASASVTVTRPTPPPPPPPTGDGPDAPARALLLSQAGPMKLLASPPPTSDRTATSTFEDAQAVSKTIGPAGGQIAVTDDAGDHITVTFPANALLDSVNITATPVATTQGADAVGAHPVGVKLEPSGLGLMAQATMTVTPADGVVDRKAEGFISASDGSDVNPEMVLPDTSKLAMPVDHFTVVTVLVPNGDGTTTTQYFTQTEYTNTLRNALIKAIEDARNTAVDNGTLVDINATIVSASNQYWNDVAMPLLNQSKTSCTFARANLVTVAQAVHGDAILGLERPEWNPGLAAVLQNCWKEATATCMVMSPSRYSELVALAREMSLLGVLTQDGHEADPFNIDWCGDVNGYFTVNLTTDYEFSNSTVTASKKEVNKAVVWVSGTSFKWWNANGTFSIGANSANPTNSTTDFTGTYTDTYSDTTPDLGCAHDLAAQAFLHQAPTGVSLPQRAYSTTTWQATDSTQGLSISGYPVTIPDPSGTLNGPDSCNDGYPGTTYSFSNWWTATINQQYTMTVDPTKGNITTHWDNTVDNGDGYVDTYHYQIDADIHVDGLKEFIAAGP